MLGFDFKKVSSIRRFRDEFEDLGSVGSGGFAQVHRVTHILTNIEYAIKIIKIKPSNSSEQTEQKIYRLMSQPKTHATLSHPNILQYHGCWIELQPYTEQEKQETIQEEDQSEPQFEMVVMNKSGGSDDIVFGSQSHGSSEQKKIQQKASKVRQGRAKLGDESKIVDYKEMRVYIISEFCTLNLQNFIYLRNLSNKSQSLTPKDIYNCFFLALQMIAGLNYLHSKRIIHRDIKLHNIMINKQGRCKLIDFGLAKKVKYWKNSIEDHYYFKGKEQMSEKEGDDQQLSSSIGTKLFSSPQQATSQNYDFRTDIYSLGIVIVLLFSSYTTSHQERDLLQKVRKRSLQDMSIPQPLKCLLFKCLGQQNERPSLGQLQKCIKQLMKQLISSQKDIHKNGFKRNSPLNYQSQEERLLIANRTKIVK